MIGKGKNYRSIAAYQFPWTNQKNKGIKHQNYQAQGNSITILVYSNTREPYYCISKYCRALSELLLSFPRRHHTPKEEKRPIVAFLSLFYCYIVILLLVFCNNLIHFLISERILIWNNWIVWRNLIVNVNDDVMLE